MEKRYANMAVLYAAAAMAFGVFYREFTKLLHFTGQTNLSLLHTHYFMLGMFFFLALLLAERVLAFSGPKTGRALLCYHLGLNIAGLGLLARGLAQVWGNGLSAALDASISGVSGIGHILTGLGMLLLLLEIRRRAAERAGRAAGRAEMK